MLTVCGISSTTTEDEVLFAVGVSEWNSITQYTILLPRFVLGIPSIVCISLYPYANWRGIVHRLVPFVTPSDFHLSSA